MSEGTVMCTCGRHPHSIACASAELPKLLAHAAKRAAEFHAHLEVCKRCANQPFNLCPAGAILLKSAAMP